MKIQVVVVEDSRLAQNELLELLRPYQAFEVVAQARTVSQAVAAIESQQPALILLDINLPDGTGFDVLDRLSWCPAVIFTTAYDEFAIQAFEANALDYLLKPISAKRFAQAMAKVLPEDVAPSSPPIDHKIFVKDNDRCWLIDIQQVRYFHSQGNYTEIHFDQQHPLIYKSLTQVQSRLPAKQFFRVNRSYVINVEFIISIEPYGNTGLLLTMDDGQEIDVSRRHTSHIKQVLSL